MRLYAREPRRIGLSIRVRIRIRVLVLGAVSFIITLGAWSTVGDSARRG